MDKRVQAKAYVNIFKVAFGMSLYKFMHPFMGFDIVAFEKVIVPPDDVSLEEAIIERYGEPAGKLLSVLIDI